MGSVVKLSPSAFQAISLHYSINTAKEIKGVLLGSIINGNVFVMSVIPLHWDSDCSVKAILNKCEDLSQAVAIPLQVVGWYHSHNELGLTLTEDDIEFHQAFEATFTNSIAFLALFGKNASDPRTKTTSFAAFRLSSKSEPTKLQCIVKPLLPSPTSDLYYKASYIAFNDIFQMFRNSLASLNADEVRELDIGFLQPYLYSVEMMINSMKYLQPNPESRR